MTIHTHSHPQQTLHIAVLDTDVPVPQVYSTRGLYSSQFRHLLQSAAARLSTSRGKQLTIHTSAWDIIGNSYPPLESLRTVPNTPASAPTSQKQPNPFALPIDALLITGAAAAAYDIHIHPWIQPLETFLKKVHAEYPHVKLFGSCFGHQILAQALLPADGPEAVKVEACPEGHEMGLTDIQLTPEFVDSFPGVEAQLPGNKMRLQMIHGDWVIPDGETQGVTGTGTGVLPKGWVNVGASARCPVQGLYLPHRVLSYQGHFEFDGEVNAETCRAFGKRLGWGQSKLEEYLGRIEEGGGKADGDAVVAAEIVVVFFAGWDL